MDLQEFLSRLDGVKQTGDNQYAAKCPSHDDNRQSLSVGLGDKGILVHCHANCDTADQVLPAMGLSISDLHLNGSKASPSPEELYDYSDEAGQLLYQVVRRVKKGEKSFLQRTPGKGRGWVYKLNGVRRVPFRLPKVLEAVQAGETIFIPEGEKDVLTLERHGFVATCNSGGAGMWLPEFAAYLKGAEVVVLPDNDKPGHDHGHDVAASLLGVAASVRVVNLPVPEKGDVTDWFFAGGTADELAIMVQQAPEYSPGNQAEDRSRPSRAYRQTDLGNAERLVDEHGDDLRYCHPWKSWLAWSGHRWEQDATGEANRRAYEMVRGMQKEAAAIEEDARRSAALKWAVSSQSASKLRAMISLAESLDGVPVLPEALDSNEWLLNVLNGTLDLKTGRLLPHNKQQLITKLAPVPYTPEARCPGWLKFLKEVFADNTEVVDYIQRSIGYSVTGSTREQCIFIPYGSGANGKGTMFETLKHLLGDYGQAMRPDLLMAKRYSGGASEGEAALRGARFVATSETGSGQRFDEALVKRLTGSDTIRARFLHANEFEFVPTHKIWLATNHKPTIEGTDHAIWRRIHLIPFTVTFEGKNEDKSLPEKLRKELPGILNWVLEGCLEWQRGGLRPPPAIVEATSQYRSEMDALAGFLDEHCETGIKEMSAQATELYFKYVNWCERSGEDSKSQRKFGMLLTERGFGKEKRRDGIWYLGIGLKAHEKDQNDD